MTIDINLYKLKGTNGKLYFLDSYLDSLHDAMRFMKQVVYEDELFSTTYTTTNGTQRTTVSSLGKHLTRLHKYIRIFSRDYTFSPLLGFFFEECRKHSIKNYFPSLNSSNREDVGRFEDFVITMRKNAMAGKLKKRVADWESKPKKNMKRLTGFEIELFNRHSRVMAVRLDLYYHKAIFTSAEIHQIYAEAALQKDRDLADYLAGQVILPPRAIEGRISLEEVQKDRKRLFTNMKGKSSLFRHLVASAWVIECGRAAGYHLHVVLFFDGSEVKKHEHYAQEIGSYWSDVITQGRGYFENCNRKKKKYGDDWALGEIDHWDTAKREKLRNALSYFCKTNQMVQVVPYPGCQLFGCGFARRQRTVRGGRPRTKGVVDPDHQRLQQ